MGPKINGNSVADLVLAAVQQQLEVEMGDYKDLLNNALARINCLEKEIAQCRQHSNPTFPIYKSSSKSDLCRHWLKNQCKWKQKCRFSHGGGASSTSLSDSNAKDLEEVAPYAKEKVDKSVQVGFESELSPSCGSTCAIPSPCSDLPSRPSYVSGVLQPDLVGAAQSYSIVDGVVSQLLDSVVEVAKQPAPVVDVTKWASPVTGPCMPASEDEEWVDNMVNVIAKLEDKYGAKYKPVEEGGVIHSAQVAIPRIDFHQVKPHLHRKLPKPDLLPVQACSIDPALYTKCTGSMQCGKEYDGSKHPGYVVPSAQSLTGSATYAEHDSSSKFTESSFPFGALPGFVTSQGVVAVPDEPIGGYVYAGGTGDGTVWQLHAQEVYI